MIPSSITTTDQQRSMQQLVLAVATQSPQRADQLRVTLAAQRRASEAEDARIGALSGRISQVEARWEHWRAQSDQQMAVLARTLEEQSALIQQLIQGIAAPQNR